MYTIIQEENVRPCSHQCISRLVKVVRLKFEIDVEKGWPEMILEIKACLEMFINSLNYN